MAGDVHSCLPDKQTERIPVGWEKPHVTGEGSSNPPPFVQNRLFLQFAIEGPSIYNLPVLS